jgi:hypothetical protein
MVIAAQTVSFTANLFTGSCPGGLGLFQTVVNNVGGAYSAVTGNFTAPVSGLYYIGFSVISVSPT